MTPEDDLAAVVNSFVAREWSVRDLGDAGPSSGPRLWQGLVEMGIPGLTVPVEFGGVGQNWSALVRVLEQTGKGLLPGPLLGTVGMALPLLLRCCSPATAALLLPSIIDGSTTVACAIAEANPRWSWNLSSVTCRAEVVDTQWELSGAKSYVMDASDADWLLVLAAAGADVALFLLKPTDTGVRIDEQSSVDLSRSLHSVSFENAPARRVDQPNSAPEDFLAALDGGRLCVASEAVGAAQACLDLAVDFARERHQFGRPIGSFQSIKHLCANLLLEVEGARSAVYAAGAEMDAGADLAGAHACLAKVVATRALKAAAAANIHIHGALGFTWEHQAHHYYRRAITDNVILGSQVFGRERMGVLLGL